MLTTDYMGLINVNQILFLYFFSLGLNKRNLFLN